MLHLALLLIAHTPEIPTTELDTMKCMAIRRIEGEASLTMHFSRHILIAKTDDYNRKPPPEFWVDGRKLKPAQLGRTRARLIYQAIGTEREISAAIDQAALIQSLKSGGTLQVRDSSGTPVATVPLDNAQDIAAAMQQCVERARVQK